MKIVKEAPSFKPFEHTCPYCDAVLLIEESDLRKYSCADQRDGAVEYPVASCISCKERLTIPKMGVPRHILAKLPIE